MNIFKDRPAHPHEGTIWRSPLGDRWAFFGGC